MAGKGLSGQAFWLPFSYLEAKCALRVAAG